MIDGNRYLVRSWTDGCIVFDRKFGDTHALDPTVAAIFSAVESGNTCFSGLKEAIKLQGPNTALNELENRVRSALDHLKRLGLVDVHLN